MKKFNIFLGLAVLTFQAQAAPISTITVDNGDLSKNCSTKEESTINEWEKNADGLVIIPVTFDPNAGFTEYEMKFMKKELEDVEAGTCIRFVPRKDEIDYIEIRNDKGCHADLGKTGGKQIISMERPSCILTGTMAHEAMHALGFNHMHQAFDRDDYINVVFENIEPEFVFAFAKLDPKSFNYFGTSYDSMSIMHYHNDAGSNNTQATIVPHDLTYALVIGRSMKLSEGDFIRINTMYDCK